MYTNEKTVSALMNQIVALQGNVLRSRGVVSFSRAFVDGFFLLFLGKENFLVRMDLIDQISDFLHEKNADFQDSLREGVRFHDFKRDENEKILEITTRTADVRFLKVS
jgi:hypothetical protein